MNSRLLEYFLRVAELGSINKAAADLHLSQPALSRHIAALEHEMGATLFNRTQGGVTLTDSGKLLSERARPLLRQFSVLKEQVSEQVAGQLAIGIPPSWQKVFTIGFVQKMAVSHPGVFLRVHEGISHMLRDYMVAGLLDLAVMPFETAPHDGYRQTALVREPLVLVEHVGSARPQGAVVSIEQLSGVRLVLPSRANPLRTLIEHSIRRKELDFRVCLEADTLQLCLELVRAGVAATIAPSSALHEFAEDPLTVRTPVKGLFVTWALFENKARTHSPAVTLGHKAVLQTLKESLTTNRWSGVETMKNVEF